MSVYKRGPEVSEEQALHEEALILRLEGQKQRQAEEGGEEAQGQEEQKRESET